ncbi:ABC transporter substrate-binding protein [Actinopolymorpha pittospori]
MSTRSRPDSLPQSQSPGITRRSALAGSVFAGLALLGACGRDEVRPVAKTGSPDAPLAKKVPKGTKLTVGDPSIQKALELSGQVDQISFDVEWANLSGGPQTLEAFRAHALDLGAVADIPPIHSVWTGIPTKIVAAKFRQDPLHHPVYQLGIAPGAGVDTLADLRGKRVAYSPGQAQGALVLRLLKKLNLVKTDVRLIELPSTGDVYPNSLAARQVDVAPIGGVNVKRYVAKYGKDGGKTIPHGLRDDPSHLYAPISTLEDPGKAAAIREYVQHWARAVSWIEEHPKEWIEGYYVKDQGLSVDDGEYLVDAEGEPDIPASWTDVIKRQQETVDLLAAETDKPKLNARDLFDLRFESVAADAFRAGGQG